jgi:hypothetical protein
MKRITDAQRAELRHAVVTGAVTNVRAYAAAYAAATGLKENTVRSALTRLRREIRDRPPTLLPMGAPGTGMTTLILTAAAPTVAHIGAAALDRYNNDDEFRRHVDRLRRENRATFSDLRRIREQLSKLSDDERAAISQVLRTDGKEPALR